MVLALGMVSPGAWSRDVSYDFVVRAITHCPDPAAGLDARAGPTGAKHVPATGVAVSFGVGTARRRGLVSLQFGGGGLSGRGAAVSNQARYRATSWAGTGTLWPSAYMQA